MASSQITKAEARFAIVFLKYMHANYENQLLVSAVVAWLRQESGGLDRVIGNNPFNIRPGMTNIFRSGVRQSRNGNGYFNIFPNLDAAAKATAYLLMHGSRTYGYYVVVAAAQRAVSLKDQKALNAQALDFLTALANSSWDAAHYGYDKKDPRTNHLVRVWLTLVDKDGMIAQALAEALAAKQKSKSKPVAKKKLPRELAAFLAKADFIDGYESMEFYAARHKTDNTLPNDADPQGKVLA